MRHRVCTPHQIAWAYRKWCLGYTREQIADALHVTTRTIDRYFAGKPRIRPELVYKEEEAMILKVYCPCCGAEIQAGQEECLNCKVYLWEVV